MSLDALLALSSILSSLEGIEAAAAFSFPLLLVTVLNSTADVVLVLRIGCVSVVGYIVKSQAPGTYGCLLCLL
jgi:hypothetical protein